MRVWGSAGLKLNLRSQFFWTGDWPGLALLTTLLDHLIQNAFIHGDVDWYTELPWSHNSLEFLIRQIKGSAHLSCGSFGTSNDVPAKFKGACMWLWDIWDMSWTFQYLHCFYEKAGAFCSWSSSWGTGRRRRASNTLPLQVHLSCSIEKEQRALITLQQFWCDHVSDTISLGFSSILLSPVRDIRWTFCMILYISFYLELLICSMAVWHILCGQVLITITTFFALV